MPVLKIYDADLEEWLVVGECGGSAPVDPDVPADPFWANTKLLLHADGTNGSTTMTDATGLTTVTAAGNAQISTSQSQFGGSSISFDGTGDYLTITDNAGLALGNGDFTIECWVRFNTLAQYKRVMSLMANSNLNSVAGIDVQIDSTATKLSLNYSINGTGWTGQITGSLSIATNTWYHIAVVRYGTALNMYQNGVITVSTTQASALYNGTLHKLGDVNYSSSYAMNGYIDEFRITKGVARYLTAFTPPVTAFPDTQSTYDPFWTNTKLLLHADGTDGSTTVTDSTGINTVAVAGNAHIEVDQYKFGTASIYLDGSGDYLTAPSVPAFGTGDWTIECFIRFSNVTSFRTFFSTEPTTVYLDIFLYEGKIYMYTGSNNITSTNTFTTNTWYHVALCKSAGLTRLFVNGVQEGATHTDTRNYTARTGGGINIGSGSTNGYLDEYRVTVGAARYTTTFTVPTEAFPNN